MNAYKITRSIKKILLSKTGSYSHQKTDSDSNDSDFHIPRILNFISTFKTKKSDAKKGFNLDQSETTSNNDEAIESTANEEFTADKDTFRTNFPVQTVNTLRSVPDTESDYFKYIESIIHQSIQLLQRKRIFLFFKANAALKQRPAVSKPYSIFTGSSVSLPTAYHESTTPYDDFGDAIEEGEEDFDPRNAFEETVDTSTDIVEAINPNVQVLEDYFLPSLLDNIDKQNI
jgi:hypothetical protein